MANKEKKSNTLTTFYFSKKKLKIRELHNNYHAVCILAKVKIRVSKKLRRTRNNSVTARCHQTKTGGENMESIWGDFIRNFKYPLINTYKMKNSNIYKHINTYKNKYISCLTKTKK